MKKQFFIFALTCFIFVMLSCKSMPRFKGEGDLCGLVVDENNEPVRDFLIYCKNDVTPPDVCPPSTTWRSPQK